MAGDGGGGRAGGAVEPALEAAAADDDEQHEGEASWEGAQLAAALPQGLTGRVALKASAQLATVFLVGDLLWYIGLARAPRRASLCAALHTAGTKIRVVWCCPAKRVS